MSTFWFIVIALICIGLIAYLLVNYIPQKFHWIFSLLFLFTIGLLSYKIYHTIYQPISFNAEKKERYTLIINKLNTIKEAQLLHKKVLGKYASDGQALVRFVDTTKIPITKVRMFDKGISDLKDLKEVHQQIDTIGYRPVKEGFVDKDYTNMFKNPFTSKEFTIEISEIKENNGDSIPVFEVKVPKLSILKGLDEKLVKEEIEVVGEKEILGEHLIMGSLTKVSIEGNWPDFYNYK